MNAHVGLCRLAGASCLSLALVLSPTPGHGNPAPKPVTETAAPPAQAAPAAAKKAPDSKARITSFGAPESPRDLSRYKEEPVPGGTFLVIAYGVMWALIAILLGRMLLSQARIEARITELEERLEDDGDS